MNVEKKNLDKARELLKELNDLEEAIDVINNYDSKTYAVCTSLYNHNRKYEKEVKIKMPAEVEKIIYEYINNRIFEIKKELEKL